MVLVPSLIDAQLDREWVMKWCKSLATRYRVVVLTASEKGARAWTAVGANVVLGDGVADAVAKLKAGTLSFAAFAQRYDGVDLPDEACRVLVLDGMPVGQGLADDLDRKTAGRTGGAYRRWINRIEQGMGRAVRSQADYAVVIITGPDLVQFLAKKEVVGVMGSATRAQFKASEKVIAMARADNREAWVVLGETANQCLGRDPGWKSFYEKNVKRDVAKGSEKPDEQQIGLADAEQRAQRAAMSNAPEKAAQIIGTAINDLKPPPEQVGWLLQRKANYTYASDPGDGLKIQAAAFDYNSDMAAPPAGVNVKKPKPGLSAGKTVLAWLDLFDNPNGILAAFADLKASLSFDVQATVLEESLKQIAPMIGAQGTRPEKTYGRGPDDVWDWPSFSWVIEAKNERTDRLPKSDGGQLHSAMTWFAENYPEREGRPIVVARKPLAEHDAFFPEGTRVLTPVGLDSLVKHVDQFLAALAKKDVIRWTPEEVGQLLIKHELSADQFAAAYTEPLKK